jgi:hypothetical protein
LHSSRVPKKEITEFPGDTALLLESRIGKQIVALVTGASSKGTWVRLLNMPVERKLVQGFEGIDVGDRIAGGCYL